MKLKKGKLTINLTNEIQIAAYKKSGWTPVQEKAKDQDGSKDGK